MGDSVAGGIDDVVDGWGRGETVSASWGMLSELSLAASATVSPEIALVTSATMSSRMELQTSVTV